MIVDDRVVVCGSANLNDRSQLGDRDSELAVIINQPASYPSSMNNKPVYHPHTSFSLPSVNCRDSGSYLRLPHPFVENYVANISDFSPPKKHLPKSHKTVIYYRSQTRMIGIQTKIYLSQILSARHFGTYWI